MLALFVEDATMRLDGIDAAPPDDTLLVACDYEKGPDLVDRARSSTIS